MEDKFIPDKKNRKKKKKKTYYNPLDVVTVFAVLAIIALACVVCSWLQKNPEALSFIYGEGAGKRSKEENESITRIAAVGIAVISSVIIGVFIAMTAKRKKKEAIIRKRKEEEMLELERARKRVEQARRKNANDNMTYNQEKYIRFDDDVDYVRTIRHYSLYDDEMYDDTARIKNDFDWEYEKDEELNLIQRIIRFFKKMFTGKGK